MDGKLLCLLVSVLVVVCVKTVASQEGTQSDSVLPREKKGLIDELLEGLENKFDRTVSKVLELKKEVFEKVVNGVKKLGVKAAKKIFGLFVDFLKNSHDIQGEQAGRVDKLMSTLEKDIEEKEAASASPMLKMSVWLGVLSLLLSALRML